MKEQSRRFTFLGTLIAYVAYLSQCLVVVTKILADVPVAYITGNGDEKGKNQFLFCIRISCRCL